MAAINSASLSLLDLPAFCDGAAERVAVADSLLATTTSLGCVWPLPTGLSFTTAGFATALRGAAVSELARACWMLLKLVTTLASDAGATAEAAATLGGGVTFSIDATPDAAGASGIGGAFGASTTTGLTSTGGTCTATTEGGADDAPESIPNLTAKYTATTASANNDIHNTRFSDVASRERSRCGAPSIVAKMLGPKSGWRDLPDLLVVLGSPNNWGRVPRARAGWLSGWVMARAARPSDRRGAPAARMSSRILERRSRPATPRWGEQQPVLATR